MEPALPPPPVRHMRPVLLAVLGLAVAGVAIGLVMRNRQPVEPMPAPLARIAAPPAPPVAPAQKPTFDIVRINRKGDTVMAGRAVPGAKVIISDGGKVIGTARADESGDWVFLPSSPLAPGARTLTLTEQTPNGTQMKGDRSVVLMVPQPGAAGQAPEKPPAFAVLTGPNVPPAILTGPDTAGSSTSGPEAAGSSAAGPHLTVGAAEYGGHGILGVTGTAAPGATVRVYLDNKLAGQAVAGPDGQWSISNSGAIAAGAHHLRVDQVAANGTVTARIEQSFTRTELELAAGKITIAPGQNLWTIARRTYGHGIRYLVIFGANRQAIRNPNLIYPGQIFALPASGPAPATPASSSTSR